MVTGFLSCLQADLHNICPEGGHKSPIGPEK